ncbi:hypothetical protein DFH09DRAFT_1352487 [Mycena vulgaris]|nr:hypothetical protein DFH09DRAFT_1352487 [Mycena vulgaris]
MPGHGHSGFLLVHSSLTNSQSVSVGGLLDHTVQSDSANPIAREKPTAIHFPVRPTSQLKRPSVNSVSGTFPVVVVPAVALTAAMTAAAPSPADSVSPVVVIAMVVLPVVLSAVRFDPEPALRLVERAVVGRVWTAFAPDAIDKVFVNQQGVHPQNIAALEPSDEGDPLGVGRGVVGDGFGGELVDERVSSFAVPCST